jgi:hypothetical protein
MVHWREPSAVTVSQQGAGAAACAAATASAACLCQRAQQQGGVSACSKVRWQATQAVWRCSSRASAAARALLLLLLLLLLPQQLCQQLLGCSAGSC